MANEMKVTITGDASSAMAMLDQFSSKIFSSVDEMTGGFGKLAAGIGGVAGAANALAGKVLEGMKEIGNFAPEASEQVNALARTFEGLAFQTGEGLHSLNVFDSTMKLTGGSIEQLSGWLTGVTRAMKSNSEVFVANGVAASNAALMQMKPIDVMRGALAVIEGETDQTKRLILAQEMLGRGAIEELPQMRRFFENIADGTDALEKYGKEIDNSGIERMKRMEKEAGLLTIQMDALKRSVAENYEPWDKFFAMVNSGWLHVADFALQAVNGMVKAIDFIGNPSKFIHEWMTERSAAKYANSPEGQREHMRAGGHEGDGQHAQTKEELEAAKAAAKKAQEDAKKAAAEAAREKKTALEVNNNLQEQTNHLEAKDLKTLDASTLALKKQQAEREALAKLNEDYHKIDSELAKADTPENQQAAVAARAAAYQTYTDQLLKIKRDTDAAQLVQDAATKAALAAAEKKALEDLKKDLAEQSVIQGQLSRSETSDRLDAYGKQGPAQAQAVKQYKLEVHWDEGAAAGALSGLRAFSAQTDNRYKTMETFATNTADSMSKGIGKAFTDMITRGQSFGAAMKGLWKDLSGSIIGELMNIAARQMVNWGVEKVIHAWKLSANATDTASAATGAAAQEAINTTEMVSSEAASSAAAELAASETWAAYAAIPFAGPALAEAQITTMMASLAAVQATAFATGGLISSPTLALMGEAGPEIVAPQHDFNTWAQANQNLGYNLASHASQVSRLNAQAGSYGRSGLAQNGGAMPSQRTIDARGSFFLDSLDAQRHFDGLLTDSDQRRGRAQG